MDIEPQRLHRLVWNNDSEGGLMWIYGNPASGKSVLSSFIIDHLLLEGRQCQYFFVRFTDQHEQSLHTLLRSVAYQIARTIPAYSDKILQLSVDAADLRSADVRNIWRWLYRSGIFTMQLERLFSWVFDGLDESDSPGTMVKLFSDLSAQEIPIRLLLISRETQETFFCGPEICESYPPWHHSVGRQRPWFSPIYWTGVEWCG